MEKQNNKIAVKVFVYPMAACDPDKSWQVAVDFLGKRLRQRYGERIQTEMIEIFSPQSFHYSEILELLQTEQITAPVITVNDRIVHSGGKLSERPVRKAIESNEIKNELYSIER